QKSASFDVASKGVNTERILQVIATLSGTTSYRRVVVKPAAPKEVVFGPATVIGGSTTTVAGRVILDGRAGSSGVVVNLTRRFLPSWSVKATIPDTVTVPAGKDRVNFPVTHEATGVDTTMIVTATANGKSASGRLLITPP
ncbi:MAG TPA: hypothetical protein VGE01_15270, partial [Fimbriimonas sp.]